MSSVVNLAGLESGDVESLRKALRELAPEVTETRGNATALPRVAAIRANPQRQHLTVQNRSTTVSLFVGLGQRPQVNGDGFMLEPGAIWEPGRVPRNAIWLAAPSSCPFVVLEG